MAIRPFLIWPHKCLRSVAEPVAEIDDEVRGIWTDMLDSMYAMPGVGLAAPQIGIMRRLAVVDCSDSRDDALRMANPEVLHSSVKDNIHNEGSPNLPGHWADIPRPRAVTVKFMNESGVYERRDFVGLWATSVQHQIDHLNGKMFFDHLSPLKRKMILAKHAKSRKRGG